jgi:hypothetical protein
MYITDRLFTVYTYANNNSQKSVLLRSILVLLLGYKETFDYIEHRTAVISAQILNDTKVSLVSNFRLSSRSDAKKSMRIIWVRTRRSAEM